MNFPISFEKIDKVNHSSSFMTKNDVLFDIKSIAYVSFSLEETFHYQVELYQQNNKWFPNKVLHAFPISCPYCVMHTSECSFLTSFSEQLVKSMMNIPQSRLKLVTTLGKIVFDSH